MLSGDQWHTLQMHLPDLAAAVDEKNTEFVVELGQHRRATVSVFKQRPSADIREWYEKDDGLKPGTKGVALSPECLEV
jgi:hypothetical protein